MCFLFGKSIDQILFCTIFTSKQIFHPQKSFFKLIFLYEKWRALSFYRFSRVHFNALSFNILVIRQVYYIQFTLQTSLKITFPSILNLLYLWVILLKVKKLSPHPVLKLRKFSWINDKIYKQAHQVCTLNGVFLCYESINS